MPDHHPRRNEQRLVWCPHTWEEDLALERNGVLTQPTAWVNLEHAVLSERSQTRKVTDCIIPL